jgi:FkbM family methyltransferase
MGPKKERRGRKQARRTARPAAIAARDPVPRVTNDAHSRAAFFDRARERTPHLTVTTQAGRFLVATSDRGVGRSLYVKRSRPEFRVLGRTVSVLETVLGREAVTDRLMIDAGANIGTATVSGLTTHGFGSAVSCEPEPENYRLLRANLALNDLEQRVQALNVAVSSRTGSSSFVILESRRGASWVALDAEQIEEAKAVRANRLAEDPNVLDDPKPLRPAELSELTVVDVELVTLDQLVTTEVIDVERTGLTWIDVEGHEGHVLAGAGALVERGVPTVLEFHPQGLDNRGDREKIHAVAEEHYTHFVDVRRRTAADTQPRLELRPGRDLRKHAERFLDPDRPVSFTDILLLRLDTDQASAWTSSGRRLRS